MMSKKTALLRQCCHQWINADNSISGFFYWSYQWSFFILTVHQYPHYTINNTVSVSNRIRAVLLNFKKKSTGNCQQSPMVVNSVVVTQPCLYTRCKCKLIISYKKFEPVVFALLNNYTKAGSKLACSYLETIRYLVRKIRTQFAQKCLISIHTTKTIIIIR